MMYVNTIVKDLQEWPGDLDVMEAIFAYLHKAHCEEHLPFPKERAGEVLSLLQGMDLALLMGDSGKVEDVLVMLQACM